MSLNRWILVFLFCVEQCLGNAGLSISGIKLEGGSGPYEGRVEVNINGVWGTICQNNFDINDAKVLCRMMNLSVTAFLTGAHYGEGIGPIFADNLQCHGYETHLEQCYFQPNIGCQHYQDVSLICTECGELAYKLAYPISVSHDGTKLYVGCDIVHQEEPFVFHCDSSGEWFSDECKCLRLEIDDIRLADGVGWYDGRVEILMNGTWGSICNTDFTDNEARVVCNMLGLSYQSFTSCYGGHNKPLLIDNVNCLGNVSHLNNCTYRHRHQCAHRNVVDVVCKNTFMNITGVRLTDGTGPNHGEVEIKVDDSWGSVCQNFRYSFSLNAFCRMIGLNYSYSLYSYVYDYTSHPLPKLLSYYYCESEADDISNCSYHFPSRCYCDPYGHIILLCTACGIPSIANGRVVTNGFTSTSVSAQCNTGYTPQSVTLTCLENGTWVADQPCNPITFPLNIAGIRLSNGRSVYHGRVELLVDGVWGTICNYGFDSNDARVICRMLGFNYKNFYRYYQYVYQSNVFVSDLNCNGTESHINNCSYSVQHLCNNYIYLVGVLCTEEELNVSSVRLAGTNGPYHGRVEIEVNNTWGTICGNGFDFSGANTICNMLGLSYQNYKYNAFYGEGSGPVYIDYLVCSGDDWPKKYHIEECSYVTNPTCTHERDISVICYGPRLNISDVRLADGTGPYDGRAEIQVNGVWGTICDSYFDINDADTFCRMLGLRGAQYFTGATHGEGNGPIFIDELFCDGYYGNLKDCPYLYLNSCSHARDVSVVCNECGKPEIYYWDVGYFSYNGTTLYADCAYYKTYVGTLEMTCDNKTKTWITEGECQEYKYPLDVMDIRLVGGGSLTKGRVELKVLNRWGTVCDHSFGNHEANTICKMIGYWPATEFYSGAFFGQGSGPIFVDDLRCTSGSVHINNCTYVTYDNCEHSNDVSVVCNDCGDPTPENGIAKYNGSYYGAEAELSCNAGYQLIGQPVIKCELSHTWSDYPHCKLIDCGNPIPEDGSANSSLTTNGSVVAITCNDGYNISGSAIITCMENETWSDMPTCTIIGCGYPEPANADVQIITNKTTVKSVVVVNCITGYSPDGSWALSCLSNGSWEAWPDCKIKDCGDPTPFKGSVNDTTTVYGTVVKVTCDEGNNIKGESVIVCQDDGTWTDYPTCDSSDCGRPSVSNGVAQLENGSTLVGSIAHISCNPGFELIGPSSLTCTLAGWNDSVRCVLKDCGDPTLNNGFATFEGTHFGSRAIMTCNIGYKLIGDSVLICQAEGTWSDRPSCELVDCGHQIEPVDGTMDISNGTVHGSTIIFRCNEGYLLIGSDNTICQPDGQWSDKPPTCVKKGGIGESCVDDGYCSTDGAVCVNNVCRCKTEIHDDTTNKCDTMPLFPYGPDAKDVVVVGQDFCSDKISFPPGIPINGKQHKDLFVCVNGLISFDVKYANPIPPENRNAASSEFTNRVILAPFYAQFNSSAGSVFYRTYDILNSYSEMEGDRKIIDFIETLGKQFGSFDRFKTSFLIIATWDKVKTYLPEHDKSKSATFQFVLASDGKVSFVMFIYGHHKMNWHKNIDSSTRVFVGFNAGEHFMHPFSYSTVVLGMDRARTDDVISGTDVSGLVFKIISKPTKSMTNPAVDCINWYNDNLNEKRKNDIVNSWMPSCPCDIQLSRFDPWFWNVDRSALHSYTCVDMVPGIIYKPYGKSCCFDNWLWIDKRPAAGGFYRYHPRNDIKNHHLHDIDPKRTCCELSKYCRLYYDLRPTGACYRTSPYNFGVFWGDPHFRTLDGLNFTFNGLGEYTLLRIKNDNVTFELQTRTSRALKADGSIADATTFIAFAAIDNSNASFHVELNRAKDGINLYVNGRDITTQYNSHSDLETPFTYLPEENNIAISKRGDTLGVLFQTIGVSLNVSVSIQMLSLNTIVPKTYRGATSGLLGNYNGISSDDFTLPNGTTLNANLTEREVFYYGKFWSINPNMSAFVYEEGKSHADYHNESYIPRFLDEADPEKRKEAERVCNGSQNHECVFDYVFTEKLEVAEDSSWIRQQADITQEELGLSVPELNGCATVIVNNSSLATCKVSMDGDYDVRFIENTAGALYNSTTHLISFFLDTADSVSISVSAVNDQGRSSPPFVVSIVLCTGCSGNGICTDEIREDPRETEYYKYLTCRCYPQYEGNDCEHVFDGCKASPCSLGRNCTSMSVAEQILHNQTYKCGPCPSGYHSKDDFNVTCLDIDECSDQISRCDHTCFNTDGSYLCSCMSGYRVDSRNSDKCRDIHECNEGLHNCSQVCNNFEGGFKCTCYDGYLFNETSWSCHENGNSSCIFKEKCVHTDGCIRQNDSDLCICNSGYELSKTDTNFTCQDINECDQNVCPQLCSNTNGGFTCSCFDGYKVEDKTTCTECEVPYWGFNCSKICNCNGQGALKCDPVKGCVCSVGWTGGTCNDVINECLSDPNLCKDPRQECVNTRGSFICRCREGFYETSNGSCDDLNECSSPLLHDCEQHCTNTLGGYTCSCFSGFKRHNNTVCEDIDECALGTAGCAQVCKNNPGLYSCFCHFGYTLNDDRMTCTKLSDPCKTINNLECSHYCYVSGNKASCRCRRGFNLGTDNQTCIDINECEDATGNVCDTDATCINTAGSYECKCSAGTRPENDGRTCSQCDAFHYGENCSQSCSCLYGHCDKTKGCICSVGWSGEKCDIDIDECKTGQLSCILENSECRNIPGSAICSCLTGYHNVTGQCQDVNECSEDGLNVCDQQCVNTPGSYRCECQRGFLLTNGKCSDIDECNLKHDGCQQICDNTIGSYRCSCESGFRLELIDRRSCKAETECNAEQTEACGNNSYCFIDKGIVTCRCEKGYFNDTLTCLDVNECDQIPATCAQQCINTEGSFTCGCLSGYQLHNDNFSCKECDDWRYGIKCNISCTCVTDNTDYCNSTTGYCHCKVGWTGTDCATDIDECITLTAMCPRNSTCRNTAGHFKCDCQTGFFHTGNGDCLECSNYKFGSQCLNDCLCDRERSSTCHHVTGDCTCKKGWKGELCRDDVNECLDDLNICSTKPNSVCRNTNASYTCLCMPGFTEEANMCKDINECILDDKHECKELCVNTVGGYDCTCKPGYYGSYNNCTVCPINHYGVNCSNRCNCIIVHAANKTQSCNSVTGKCECNSSWSGETCNEDVDECENQTICPDDENKGCINTEGSFKCECYSGFIKADNRTCMQDKFAKDLDLKMKIKDIDVSKQHITDNYDTLRQDLELSIRKLYRYYIKEPLRIRVYNIAKGSLIVWYHIIHDTTDTNLGSHITKSLVDQSKGIARLPFNGTTFFVLADDYIDMEPCDIYQSLFGSCREHFECKVENSTPYCRSKTKDSSPKGPDIGVALMVGLAVGSCVLLFTITAFAVCMWHKNNKIHTVDSSKLSGSFEDERYLRPVSMKVANTKFVPHLRSRRMSKTSPSGVLTIQDE